MIEYWSVLITKSIKKLGIDKAIAYSALAKIVQAGGGLALIALISVFLTKEEQGFYYTFGSIIAIQIFFELGLNSIITQYVAHEIVHLKWESTNEVSGSPIHLSRVSSLLRFSLRLFSFLALALFIILELSGYYFFSKFSDSDVQWQLPWQVVALSTSLMLPMSAMLAFMEGLGKVKEVAKMRLGQSVVNIATIAIMFVVHAGLMAVGIAGLASFLYVLGSILFSNCKDLIFSIFKQKREWAVSYWNEIFPYQYKIALSWISGYFIFQLFNPVLFAIAGPVVAGQMGMTLAAFTGISNLSMSWINTKVPLFSGLIAQHKYNELDAIFGRTVGQLIFTNVLLIAVFITSVLAARLLLIPLADRFLSNLPLIVLAVTVIVNQVIFSWATYLRCHKREPFLLNSIIVGILCATSTFTIGKWYGLIGMVSGYAIIVIAVAFPWAAYIFFTKRKLWHSA